MSNVNGRLTRLEKQARQNVTLDAKNVLAAVLGVGEPLTTAEAAAVERLLVDDYPNDRKEFCCDRNTFTRWLDRNVDLYAPILDRRFPGWRGRFNLPELKPGIELAIVDASLTGQALDTAVYGKQRRLPKDCVILAVSSKFLGMVGQN